MIELYLLLTSAFWIRAGVTYLSMLSVEKIVRRNKRKEGENSVQGLQE